MSLIQILVHSSMGFKLNISKKVSSYSLVDKADRELSIGSSS